MVNGVPDFLVFPDPPEESVKFTRTFGNYFLFKQGRIPQLWFGSKPNLPDPDTNRDEWDAYLVSQKYGLVTLKQLDDAGVPPTSPIREDVNVLNRTIVRAFIDEDFNAQYWQNQYFLFQWLFAFLALFATIFAALTTVLTVSEATKASLLPNAPSSPIIIPTATFAATSTGNATAPAPNAGSNNSSLRVDYSLAAVFGALTTIIGAFVTVFVYIYNRDRPQRTWYEKRRNAESLRKQYFLYLTHMPPYDNQRHIFALQTMSIRIQNSDPKKLEIAADTPPRSPALTSAESTILLNLYNTLRIQEQMKYYKRRSREYDYDGDVTLLITLIIPLIVSLLAGWNIAQTNPFIATVVVILPNLGGLFATFQRVYDWEPQQALYAKTFAGLQAAKIIDPLGKTNDAILRELVNAVESELTKETDQWGASVETAVADLSAEQIIDAFKKKVDSSNDEINQEVAKMRERLKLDPMP